jgi:hypothetical protein
MKKILFSGCSYVAGIGFKLEKEEPGLWVNLLYRNTCLKNYNLINCSRGGRSNQGIFQDTVWHLTREHHEYAFVSWTSMPRYELELGLETYSTNATFLPNAPMRDHNINKITYTRQYLESIRDRFTTLAHLHFEILNLIYYVNSLVQLAKLINTKIFFINSICPWDQNYFNRLDNVLPDKYTTFTKHLIGVDNRDDEEIFNLYNKLHNEYDLAGGIQEQFWLNLYDSLRTQKIDVNDDGVHPGINSNQLYFKFLSQAFNK